MSSFGKLATLGPTLAAVFGATMARGDAPCNAGFRDATAAERARMTAILEIAKESLPPAPAGWQITGYEEISVPGRVCRDDENRPWGFGISRNYTRADDYEVRAMVLYGGWQRDAQAKRWMSARRANAVPTAAHVISVEVVGDPSRIDPLLQGIDFTNLATALTR